MHFITLLPALCAGLGTAVAAPGSLATRAPRNLKVTGVSVLGTGCPYGSADVWADPSNTALEIRLSEYVVRTGPNTMAADWRKNCKLTLNLEYDAGFQLATLDTAVTGWAHIPSGAQGQCQNTFDFTGSSGEANYRINLGGGYDGRFSLSADPDVAVRSPCGGSTAILNMNTQCWISPTEKQALIAVDRISSKLTVRVNLQWRNC